LSSVFSNNCLLKLSPIFCPLVCVAVAPGEGGKTERWVFPSYPARQRRKLICLLSSLFYPLKLSSVFSNSCPLNDIPFRHLLFSFYYLPGAGTPAILPVFCSRTSLMPLRNLPAASRHWPGMPGPARARGWV
ncbi:MAG: hypothetical protein LBD06_00165, partial [Candidatus Accumulibacter sp.]|nr:hypothetical protein [Accumulibacter sp.]